MKHLILLVFSACFFLVSQAQDTTKTFQSEEDYSQYGDVEYVGSETKTYANPKINGLSPQRFASIAWDAQGAHTLKFSDCKRRRQGELPRRIAPLREHPRNLQ